MRLFVFFCFSFPIDFWVFQISHIILGPKLFFMVFVTFNVPKLVRVSKLKVFAVIPEGSFFRKLV